MTEPRSWLFVPADSERKVIKALDSEADAIIFDLEDATAPDAKVEARSRVCAAVASGEYGHRELTIRVNGLDTEWHADDLRAAGGAAGRERVVAQWSWRHTAARTVEQYRIMLDERARTAAA